MHPADSHKDRTKNTYFLNNLLYHELLILQLLSNCFMSDTIKHECGLIFIRLRKPLSYYLEKYGTCFYGLNKLYLLMEKQRNRGQDGAGMASMKLYAKPNYPSFYRVRSNATDPIAGLFKNMFSEIESLKEQHPEMLNQPAKLKENFQFLGELILGHLRYGTQGKNNLEYCHPFISVDPVPTRNIALAGNFNVVNVKELFQQVGIHPRKLHAESDLAAMLEVIKYFIVKEDKGTPDQFDLIKILKQAASLFDGGYHLGGLIGNGDGFILRDPYGIRPSYYYVDSEIVVGASERPALQTAFGIPQEKVKELEPGHALIVKGNGAVVNQEILPPQKKRACSFERIYFSRGNDSDIHKERISLGYALAKKAVKAIDYDFDNSVFSYIPNTAETAFYGLVDGAKNHLEKDTLKRLSAQGGKLNRKEATQIIRRQVRVEKFVTKDVKMRTFITKDSDRNAMVEHVYDITYGALQRGKDTLVIIDDSIVRGTTLRQSILKMLDRLEPKRILILSSAPQIRYPDCYGIDMSKVGEFVAFRAAIDLLVEKGKKQLLYKAYAIGKELQNSHAMETQNVMHLIYEHLTEEEISERTAKLITPKGMKAKVNIIFQSVDDLHRSCPDHLGDWYFTGHYPTPGGNRVVNQAFLNFMENKNKRGY